MASFVELFNDAQERLATATPEQLLAWASDTFSPRVGISCSFGGPGGIILAHMAYRLGRRIPLLFIDTDFLFPETYELKESLRAKWGLAIRTARALLSEGEQAAIHGDRLWERDPDRCCEIRKVRPMVELLQDLDCWITSLRRDQSPSRADTETFELHRLADGREILKLNPLCHWTRKDVWRYVAEHKLPYNPLLDQGYKSLGCTHCTAPVDGGDERAGRWHGHAKTECGLHTFTQGVSGRSSRNAVE